MGCASRVSACAPPCTQARLRSVCVCVPIGPWPNPSFAAHAFYCLPLFLDESPLILRESGAALVESPSLGSEDPFACSLRGRFVPHSAKVTVS